MKHLHSNETQTATSQDVKGEGEKLGNLEPGLRSQVPILGGGKGAEGQEAGSQSYY